MVAPAVITLHSGSALAASSALRCFNNLPTGAAVAPVPDNIFRVLQYDATVGANDAPIKVFSGTDIRNIAASVIANNRLNPGSFAADAWYDVGNNAQIAPNAAPTATINPQVNLALLLVNDPPDSPTFRIVGVSGAPAAGDVHIMTTSCWGSFM